MPHVGVNLAPGRLDSPYGAGDSSGNLKIGDSSGGTNRVVYRVVPQTTGTLWDIWLETRARSGPNCSPQLADADAAESSSYSGGNPNNWLWEIRLHPMKSDGSGWFDPSVNLMPAIQFNPYTQRRNTSFQIDAVLTDSALKIPINGNSGLAVTAGTPIALTVAPANGSRADYASVNQIYFPNGREGAAARNEVGTNATDAYYGVDPRVTLGGSSSDGSSQWYPGNNFNTAPFTKHLPTFLMVYSDGTIHGQEHYSAASGSAPTLAGTLYTMNFKVPSNTTFTHLRAIFDTPDSFQATIAVGGVDQGTVTFTCASATPPGTVVTAKLPAAVPVLTSDTITVRFTCNVQNAVVRCYSNGVFDSLLGHGSGYYASLTGDVNRVMPVMPVPWPFPRLIAGSVPTGAPATPAGLTATPGPNTVALSWTANGESYLDHYNIYRGGVLLTTVTGATTYSDATAVGGNTYSYTISAVALDGRESAQSGAQTATPTVPAVISFVGERLAFKTGTAAGNSLILTLASGTTIANHLVCAVMGRNSGATISSVTDSKGNTWTVDKQSQDAGANTTIGVCSAHLTTALATSDTVTVNFAAAPGPAVIAYLEEFAGIKTSGSADQSAAHIDTSTQTALTVGPTGVTGQATELAIAAWVMGNTSPTGLTAASGYTAFTTAWQDTTGAASNRSGGGEYKILAAAAAQTATATVAPTGTSQNGVLVTYRGA